MDLLMAMRIFVNVAEFGSFVRAASYVGVSTAVATRHVVALEDRLGTRLLYRTTRRLSLTEPGVKYLNSAQRLLNDLELAEEEVAQSSHGPVGTLRIVSSTSFAQHCLTPLIPSFMARFPNIVPNLTLVERQVDLVEEGFDTAVIVPQQVRHASTVTRLLNSVRMVVCASPDYLKRHGAPRHPSALESRACLVLSTQYSPKGEYVFRLGHRTSRLKLASLIPTDNDDVLRRLALLGVGIAILPEYAVAHDIASGALVELLQEYELPNLDIQIAYPNRRHLPVKVRSFVDYLVEHFDAA
jgi:DNA-binding transcriptional LysR family regulator